MKTEMARQILVRLLKMKFYLVSCSRVILHIQMEGQSKEF
jgi:hypothetical protein